MTHVFAEDNQIKREMILLSGETDNHIRHVLRMRVGEPISVSVSGKIYEGTIDSFDQGITKVKITSVHDGENELSNRIVLFQGMPKSDKLEWILQKATELGVSEIVPVFMSRSIVRLEEKKEEVKRERRQAIVRSAAEQSHRDRIPDVHSSLSFKEAMEYAKSLDLILVPYEKETDIKKTREVISGIKKGTSIGIFIGPEGGISEEEIELLLEVKGIPITLGKRILRTETAPITILSILMFQSEEGM